MTADRSVAVLAHGLGGSTDLPIPFTYALIGAAWALTFTFAVVALAWRRPRFDPDKPGRALPPWVSDVGRRPGHPLGRRRSPACCSRSGWRWRRSSARRTPTTRCPACSTCCCGSAWWRCRWRSDRCGARSRRCARCTGCSAGGRCARIPSRWATGPRCWACSRSCGWNSPALTRDRLVRSGSGCWSTWPSRWPARCAAVTAGAPVPTRSRCTAWWCRGCRRCGATATAASRSATRSTTCRHCRCGPAPSRCWRCCWGRRRSTASRRGRSGAASSTRRPGPPRRPRCINTAGLLVFAGRGRGHVLAGGQGHRRGRPRSVAANCPA